MLTAQLKSVISERYRSNWQKSLADFYALDPDFLALDDHSINYAVNNAAAICETLEHPTRKEQLVQLFVENTLRFTFKQNQYIYVDKFGEQVLIGIYREYLDGMHDLLAASAGRKILSQQLIQLHQDHILKLRANLAAYLPAGSPGAANDTSLLTPSICSDYSAAHQLAMLNIRLRNLQNPVLDIGCGQSAELVTYLQQRGYKVLGIDRILAELPHTAKSDWLDYDYGRNRWGSIISHLAFSNHFFFQHYAGGNLAEKYAQCYMQILASLRPGGTFYYTPGLPFIEQYLPREKFIIEKEILSQSDAVKFKLPQKFPSDHLYRAKIIRCK